MRSPSWSPDGKQVVHEVTSFTPTRPMKKKLYSWDGDWEYRFTDVFPQLSNQGRLAITQKQLGNSSVVTMDPDGNNMDVVFDTYTIGEINASLVVRGLAGAFQPSCSPDGEWISFGLGAWLKGARLPYDLQQLLLRGADRRQRALRVPQLLSQRALHRVPRVWSALRAAHHRPGGQEHALPDQRHRQPALLVARRRAHRVYAQDQLDQL
ncbi:hypothetical protein IWX50DRAFT_124308 [Phyllosticta citricarpa]